MSVVLEYPAAGKDANQLHDALIAASLTPERVEVRTDVTTAPDPLGGPDIETFTQTIVLTMPDGTVEAEVDAVVAAHVPMARYDPATQLARIASVREIARLKADYDRVLEMGDAIVTLADATACLHFFIETLIRRDRAAGLY